MPRWVDNEVWREIDAMADGYTLANGLRPDRMVLGRAAALKIEGPQADGHPLHLVWEAPTSGVWFPSQPERLRPWQQFKRERACKKAGGHWWHPADGMIEWFCCVCGKDRDGTPQDGT